MKLKKMYNPFYSNLRHDNQLFVLIFAGVNLSEPEANFAHIILITNTYNFVYMYF